MQKLPLFIVLALLLTACGNSARQENEEKASLAVPFPENYVVMGEEFTADGVLTEQEMIEKYGDLKVGDTLTVKLQARVNAVCKNKGCWMKLGLNEGQEAMVRFKDYAFFVPKDIETKEVVVNGKAYVSEMSIEDQRHYAEDEGRTAEEVGAITAPKRTLSFLAEGVVIKEEN